MSILKLKSLIFTALSLVLFSGHVMADPVPLVCKFQYPDGRERTKVFSLDLTAKSSDIGNDATLNLDSDTVTLTWESLDCENQRKVPGSTLVCMNNYLFINRKTLEASGQENSREIFGLCEIKELQNQF